MPNSRSDLPDPIPDNGPILPTEKEKQEEAWANSRPGWWPWLVWLCVAFAVFGIGIIWRLHHGAQIP